MSFFQVEQQIKDLYWNHFIERWIIAKVGGGNGVTGPRLRKIKPIIMADREFWADVYWRHNGDAFDNPEEMAKCQPRLYEHCLGNFWGMIMQTLVEQGLVK